MHQSALKIALLLSDHGPLYKGKSKSIEAKCMELSGRQGSTPKLSKHLIWRWWREGIAGKRKHGMLEIFCKAVARRLGRHVDSEWIRDPTLSVESFARKVGLQKCQADYALAAHILNHGLAEAVKAFMHPAHTADVDGTHAAYGVYIVDRWRREEDDSGSHSVEVPSCLLVVDKYVRLEHHVKSDRTENAFVFAKLYVPYKKDHAFLKSGFETHHYEYNGVMLELGSFRYFLFKSTSRQLDDLVLMITDTGDRPVERLSGKYLSVYIAGRNQPGTTSVSLKKVSPTINDAIIRQHLSKVRASVR